ncbi:hypothetical protein PQR75_05300 [Paraburkholderia fungorum]|uniref:hypothetical protein n=1 Tax=Paraburkholderia fungorum TaxID=134537 RepID=UPI0038B75168
MNKRSFRGNVTAVLSHGSFGGAIFSLKLHGARQRDEVRVLDTIVVVADSPFFIKPPLVGEAWNVTGDWEDRPPFGRQLKASSVSHWKPTGSALVEFIGRSGLFGGLTMREAKRLGNALGPTLREALDGSDLAALRVPRVRFRHCMMLAEYWHQYWSLAELTDLLPQEISPTAVERIQLLLGREAHRQILDNPYRLAPFITWSALDGFALKLGSSSESTARRVGACEELLVRSLSRGRFWLKYTYVLDRLATRLGTKEAAKASIALSLAYNVARVVRGSDGDYIQAFGAALIQTRLCERLVVNRHDGKQLENLRTVHTNCFFEETSSRAVVMVSAPLQTVSTVALRLSEMLPDAVHIIGSVNEATKETLNEAGIKLLAARQMLHNGRTQDHVDEATFIVHNADELCLITLNKLLHRISVRAQVVLAGQLFRHPPLTDGPSVFADIWLSKRLPTFELFPDRCIPIHTGKPAYTQLEPTSEQQFVSGNSLHWHKASGALLMLETAGAYRESAHFGSALLLTEHAFHAAKWNMQFHNENCELRQFHGQSSPVFRLHNQQSACPGDPIVWSKSSLGRGIVAGMHGVLVTSDPNSHALPQGTGAAVLPPTLEVERLTQYELADCSLGYAIPLRVPFLFDVDYVVLTLLGTESPETKDHLLRRALSHARCSVIVVSEQCPKSPSISMPTGMPANVSPFIVGHDLRMVSLKEQTYER